MDTIAEAHRTRVFKRYPNRKFYDPFESRYVNYDVIARVIKAGSKVKVLDAGTLADVTGMTLARILSREEKKRTARTSADTLCGLIRAQAAEQQLAPAEAPADGDDPGAEAPDRDEWAIRPETADRLVGGILSRGQRAAFLARERLAASRTALASLDARARGRAVACADVVAAIGRVGRQLARISARIDGLHERLRDLEAP